MYNEIKKIMKNDESFYQSKIVYEIIKQHIQSQSLSLINKSLFCCSDKYYQLLYETSILKDETSVLKDEINILKKEIDSGIKSNNNQFMVIEKKLSFLEKNDQYIENKINIRFLFSNTYKKIKKKLLRK